MGNVLEMPSADDQALDGVSYPLQANCWSAYLLRFGHVGSPPGDSLSA